MNFKEIEEINKYCEPHSILVVTNKKRLVRLKCPFQVEFLKDIDSYKAKQLAIVNAVKINLNLQMVYEIDKKNYHYSYFKIIYFDV